MLGCSLYAQTTIEYIKDDYLKKHWKTGSLIILGGAAEGYMDVLDFHYKKFERLHPGANESFWNPSLSNTNKYKNNDINQGETFFMSSRALVCCTDGWHAMKAVRNISYSLALTINISDIGKKSLGCYAVDLVYYTMCRYIGFELIYSVIYK